MFLLRETLTVCPC